MRAVCWYGREDVRVADVREPSIINERDAIVRVTSTSICGSDIHLYGGYVPAMRKGDILGHEFMGEVAEVGPEVRELSPGDRVVVPANIACGHCFFCHNGLYSLCDDSNPNASMSEERYGYSPGGAFGSSDTFGGYAGGQAEYVRVPLADAGPVKVPDDLTDDQALFLSDAFPTGWQAAEQCRIRPGQTIAVWGCGPVGQFAIRSAFLLGASRVIAIDRFPARLAMAEAGGAETIDYTSAEVPETLRRMTGGLGPDACIDAVGMEAHAAGLESALDRARSAARLETERPFALFEAIAACGKGGVVSVAGAYDAAVDGFPMGTVFNKGLALRAGQSHVQRYMRPLLERVQRGEIDPSFVVTHRMPLEQAPEGYRMFRDKTDACVKVVLQP
jgi:threonine dehydrogenase-like Zn-dependent dehydrogenase